MENIDLDSVRPLAPVNPLAYGSAGVGTESEPAAFTVKSDSAASGGVNSGGVIASIDDRGGLLVGSGDLAKRKRGGPRKSHLDGSSVAPRAPPQQGPVTPSGTTTSFHNGGSSAKRGRGRPKFDAFPSLGELLASTSGGDFTPHVVTVHAGEDIAGKILALAQQRHHGICVLSANGSVSNVTLRQPGSYGGLLTHEGHFEILTLKGSFTTSEKHGLKSRSGGLSVSLAGSDGSVIGGVVPGSLIAANPVQIVLGTFATTKDHSTQKRKIDAELPESSTHAVPSLPGVLNGPGEGNAVASQFPVQENPGEIKNCSIGERDGKSASNDSDWGGGFRSDSVSRY